MTFYNYARIQDSIPEISVIMPAFNEEKAVGKLIDRTKTILNSITHSYEIIVVDDGSKDQTLNICQEKHVILVHNHYNCGKGYALREGFKLAKGAIIITIDSDGEHRPEEIPLLIKPLLNWVADIALGTRFLNNGGTPITSAINTFGNRFFNFIIRGLTNRHFTDTQCGFRAFKKEAIQKFYLKSSGYDIETEMIIQLALENIKYKET